MRGVLNVAVAKVGASIDAIVGEPLAAGPGGARPDSQAYQLSNTVKEMRYKGGRLTGATTLAAWRC